MLDQINLLNLETNTKSLETVFKGVFPSRQVETQLQKSRRVLGNTATDIPDEELQKYITEFQYLIDSWLDEYEQDVFSGQTLGQVLREG